MVKTLQGLFALSVLSIQLVLGQVVDVTDFYSSGTYFFPQFVQLGEHDGFEKSQISALAEDQEGYIWIGTNHGLCYFNPFREQFISLNGRTPDEPVGGSIFHCVAEDKGGILYFGTATGIQVLEDIQRSVLMNYKGHDIPFDSAGTATRFVMPHPDNPRDMGFPVMQMAYNGNGHLYFTTPGRLLSLGCDQLKTATDNASGSCTIKEEIQE
ncbi:MAG: two-component regulator propeller domain-containing protein [Bacteroidota bacterium]